MHPGSQTEIKEPNGHLNWYVLDQEDPEPQRTIRFRNQFGQHSVIIQNPKFLLVPAQKTSDAGSQFPESLDHYKCYEVIEIETIPNLPSVGLSDQFVSGHKVQVGAPRFFCLPVKKEVPGAPTTDIINEENHLAIYDLPPERLVWQIRTRDQFRERPLVVQGSVMLAVPSEKQTVATH